MGKENLASTYNEQFSLKKKNEILNYVTIWMNLEDIELNEKLETEGQPWHDPTYMRDRK